MRISISNIAWDVVDDESMAEILQFEGISAIDIAPGKYFKNFQHTTSEDTQKVKKWWKNRGIDIVGMQALFFGTEGLNLFSNTAKQMNEHLVHVMRIGSELGATKLVFGSPKNRDRSGLSDVEAQQKADDFFGKAADVAQKLGVILCLETNPPAYSCNFMVKMDETAKVVSRINHPHVRMQLDIGAMLMNQESAELIKKYTPLIGHIHLSEPHLKPLGSQNSNHAPYAEAFSVFQKDTLATIEMVKPPADSLMQTQKSLHWALENYGKKGF